MAAHPKYATWAAVILTLLALAVGGGVHVYGSFRESLDAELRNNALELQLLASVFGELLQRGEYQDLDVLAKGWGVSDGTIVEIGLVARTGVTLAAYQRREPVQHSDSRAMPISYSYRGAATLRVTRSLDAVYSEVEFEAAQFAAAYAIVAVMLLLMVRTSLRRYDQSQLLARQRGELARSNSSLEEEIARRSHLEELLLREKERAETTLRSLGEAVITTDVHDCVDSLNPAAEHLLGWTVGQARGHPLREVCHLIDVHSRQPLEAALPDSGLSNAVAQTREAVLVARSGKEFAVEECSAPLRDGAGQPSGRVLVVHDVTAQRHLLQRIAWQASHDVLTNLPNRALLADRLAQAVAHAQRHEQMLAVCFVDLDDFKPVNDTHGHAAGDQLLCEVAGRLSKAVRSGDTVARLGGDEFVVLLTDLSSLDELEPALDRLVGAMAAPCRCADTQLQLSASIGVTVYPRDDADADTLLRHADHAMYLAKQAGRNRYYLFDPEQENVLQARRLWTEDLRLALRNGELRVWYQPKVNLRSGTVTGMEALLRWRHPQRGLLGPMEFLPQIEHNDLIVEIGDWVIGEALAVMEQWRQAGIDMPVSVNIAARQFQHPQFVARLQQALRRFPNLSASALELEILESAALHDVAQVREVIGTCRELGIPFALDDFGTGYASLSYLRELPAETLKIDQSFIRNMLDNKDDRTLVASIVTLAGLFQRQVIAEGLETVEHGILLMRLGCDLAQGYAIALPMPPAAVLPWLKAFRPDPQWTLWAGGQWDMADLPLLTAKLDHARWVDRVIASIDDVPLELSEEELRDHHVCRFGTWYYGMGRARYGDMPEFAQIEQDHVRIHSLALQLCSARDAGQHARARALVPTLLETRGQLLARLDALHAQVSAVVPPRGVRAR